MMGRRTPFGSAAAWQTPPPTPTSITGVRVSKLMFATHVTDAIPTSLVWLSATTMDQVAWAEGAEIRPMTIAAPRRVIDFIQRLLPPHTNARAAAVLLRSNDPRS